MCNKSSNYEIEDFILRYFEKSIENEKILFLKILFKLYKEESKVRVPELKSDLKKDAY